MRNLIKKGDPIPHFKPNVLEAGQYVIKVGEHERVYTYTPPSKYPTHMLCISFTNVLWMKENPQDPPEIKSLRRKRRIYPNIEEQISFSASDYMNGIVKIRKYGNVDDWIPVDDIIEVEYPIVLDKDKVKPGSIWRLTIDGDERFQDTVIMVIGPEGSRPLWHMRFLYQTEVIYNNDFRNIETAEATIDWDSLRGNDKKVDFNKIHMVPVDTNNHICTLNRTDDDEVYYPRSTNGFCEVYPYVSPQERAKNDFGF